jgi:tetratricopeptide (TPR) repeat protein
MFSIFLFVFSLLFFGNEIPYQELLLNTKELIKKWEKSLDEGILLEAFSILKKNNLSENYLYHYYLALTEYQLALSKLQRKDKSEAKKYIKDGLENLEKSIQIKEDFSESYILLSSLTALRISITPVLSPFLGPKSSKYLDKAIQLEPNNPRAHLTKGIALLNTPSLFGGDVSKAIKELEMAISLFEKKERQDPLLPDWGGGDAYLWLAHAYFKNGNAKKAIEVATVGINKYPDFLRLKKYLEKLKKSWEEKK